MRGELGEWLRGFVFEGGFLARYPYYAHVIAGLDAVRDPSVERMAVSFRRVPGRGGRFFLHVNIEAVSREPQFVRGLLLHEVHHVVLGHLTHPKYFGVAHPELLSMAMEASANEYVDEALPSPLLWEHFREIGFRARQSTMERYELLVAAREDGEEPRPSRPSRPLDPHEWVNEATAPVGGVEHARQVITRARDEGEGDAKRMEVGVPRLAGKTPDQLLLELVGTDRAPAKRVDWRRALQDLVSQGRAPHPTWARPSRRFPTQVGVAPGRTFRPRAVPRSTLLVAIDTSASMSRPELEEIARQLRPIAELARVLVAECDVEVRRVYPFRGALSAVMGRGGTDLRPVLDARFLRARGADGVVYFTDGEGPAPEVAPGVPVLWVLTKEGPPPVTWGRTVRFASH
ncbi:MAG: hypothetical protein H6721_33500 [Sandaracinus sp.]|nr:hypothetical protein [Sandaracinus sp.]MCB9617438.1 hypothetical protein [Sandaracinus sp.]MCB9621467.1 hypothetical protein [Sandaracinus sp.]MCB9623713.1 hypothetical protein [Sandaracinus sp.]MCB9634467.1 hypothetical protein [Sandaracinus sp.]